MKSRQEYRVASNATRHFGSVKGLIRGRGSHIQINTAGLLICGRAGATSLCIQFWLLLFHLSGVSEWGREEASIGCGWHRTSSYSCLRLACLVNPSGLRVMQPFAVILVVWGT